jgi:hypothetical protein
MAALIFSVHCEVQGELIFAVCDHAPLRTFGVSEDDAWKKMQQVARAYLELLQQRGELEAAIAAGLLRTSPKTPTWPGNAEVSLEPYPSVAA